jgi:hypothetical protein
MRNMVREWWRSLCARVGATPLMLLVALSVAVMTTACSPGLGVRLAVPPVGELAAEGRADYKADSLKIRVGSFFDARKSDIIAVVNGREVKTDGNVGAAVQEALIRYARDVGMDVVQFRVASLSGEVTDWEVKVDPSFPASSATAKARVNVELRSADDSLLYRASYAGEATKKHIMLSENGVKEVLGHAMRAALEEVVNDRSLVQRIPIEP